MRSNILSLDQIRAVAPSVFATQPYEEMSGKYRFFPTIDVVEALMKNGFVPVDACQSNVRSLEKKNYTRHRVRFRHMELANAAKHAIEASGVQGIMRGNTSSLPEIPEIVLLNSHDGSSSYQIDLGFFRQVCANGLIVQSGECESIRVRHSGGQDIVQDVVEGSFQIIDQAPKAAEQIAAWKQIKLERPQQEAFAEAALEVRETALEIQPRALLQPRRSADTANDLWSTMNVVQENLIKGGAQGRNGDLKRRTLRGVNSVDGDTKLNRALWKLAERMAQLAA